MSESREEKLENLRNLHKELKEDPRSALLYNRITNLENELGLTLKFVVSFDGTFDYEPDSFLLEKGYYKEEFDVDEKDIIKQLYK